MYNWLSKIFGFSSSKKVAKNLFEKLPETKAVQTIVSEVQTKVEPAVNQVKNCYYPTMATHLASFKVYYGIDSSAKPTIKKFANGIEKRYPCKDGGEVVVNYVKRADKS